MLQMRATAEDALMWQARSLEDEIGPAPRPGTHPPHSFTTSLEAARHGYGVATDEPGVATGWTEIRK